MSAIVERLRAAIREQYEHRDEPAYREASDATDAVAAEIDRLTRERDEALDGGKWREALNTALGKLMVAERDNAALKADDHERHEIMRRTFERQGRMAEREMGVIQFCEGIASMLDLDPATVSFSDVLSVVENLKRKAEQP